MLACAAAFDVDVTGYLLVRGSDANSLTELAADTGNTATRYTDTTVAASTANAYVVAALSPDGESKPSAVAVALTPRQVSQGPDQRWRRERSDTPSPTPAAPSDLNFTALFSQVSLTWADPQDDSINGYRICRGPDPNRLPVLAENTGSTDTPYADATVAVSSSYVYAVAAINAQGVGAQTRGSMSTPAEPVVLVTLPPVAVEHQQAKRLLLGKITGSTGSTGSTESTGDAWASTLSFCQKFTTVPALTAGGYRKSYWS